MDPINLVRDTWYDNPEGDGVVIRRIVRDRVLKGDSTDYLPSFVDATTDRCYNILVLQRRREELAVEREGKRQRALKKEREEQEKEANDLAYRKQAERRRAEKAAAAKAAEDKAFAHLHERIALNGKRLGDVTKAENAKFMRFHQAVDRSMPKWSLPHSTLDKTHPGDKLGKLRTW